MLTMEPASFDTQVAALLLQPDSDIGSDYLKQVCLHLGCSDHVEVRSAGPGRGKGIFAVKKFQRGDAIFQERPLVAIQHASSRGQCLVCSHCYRFLGSIEEQVARKLRYTLSRVQELQQQQQQQQQGGAGSSGACAPADASGAAGGGAGSSKTAAADGAASDEDGGEWANAVKEVDPDELADMKRRLELIQAAGVDAALLDDLASGRKLLPLSNKFPLPKPVPCRLGCGAIYCGSGCEEAAWKLHHQLLCCPSEQAAAAPSQTSAPPSGTAAASAVLQPDRGALTAFYKHAAGSNEIFGLAAKVLAVTVARAEALKAGQAQQGQAGTVARAASGGTQGGAAAEGGGSQSPAQGPWPAALLAADAALRCQREAALKAAAGGDAGPSGSVAAAVAAGGAGPSGASADGECSSKPGSSGSGPGPSSNPSPHSLPSAQGGSEPCSSVGWAALKQAWLPFASGWKRVWWESVAVPDDVEDEASFRGQLRWLACRSLRLLRTALPGAAACYGPLFSEQVYGAVVGMFELNNLSLTVPTPVEDYFLMVDDLPEAERATAQVVTQPLLDALDKSYDEPCEGTAFFALQSCANHSCCPAATIEGEGSGEASILALSTIKPGDEVTISYIDEELGFKDRQAALRDYGFKCSCAKCESDRAKCASGKKVTGKRQARQK